MNKIAELRPSHGNVAMANADSRRGIPDLQALMDIPPSVAGVYEMRDEEIRRVRSRIYALNKDNHYRWRWRTLKEKGRGRYSTLLVWRIH